MAGEQISRVTPAGCKCFFGYYDKSALSYNDEFLLFHRAGFQDRAPRENDSAEICAIERKTGRIEVIGETRSWNFQQGAMLQWLPGGRIIYNTVKDGGFRARITDLAGATETFLERPVSAVSADGKIALSLNFSRLAQHRPGYGYEGIPDEFECEQWPRSDGLYLVDIEEGKCKLIITLERMLSFRHEEGVSGKHAWFNHTLFSPDGKKFVFLNRWRSGDGHLTRLFVSDTGGKEPVDLIGSHLVSHFDWKNSSELVVWAEIGGDRGFFIVDVESGLSRPVSSNLQSGDGHCSFSRNGRRLLLDSYPVEGFRRLSLFDTVTERQSDLGCFFSPPRLSGPIRCDLHPGWSFSEKYITFDSAHEGDRAVYLVKEPFFKGGSAH